MTNNQAFEPVGTVPWGSLSPSELCAAVRALPQPRCDLSAADDPRWVVPVELFGLTPITATPFGDTDDLYAAWDAAEDGTYAEAAAVPVTEVVYTWQTHVRVDAVAHYLSGGGLFDSEPVFGGARDAVVLTDSGSDGYVVFDGTSRVTAARVSGLCEIRACQVPWN